MSSAQLARERLVRVLASDGAAAASAQLRISNSGDLQGVPFSDELRMREIFGLGPTGSGAVVNETTAMKVSVVYRCASLIAGAVASTPFDFFRYQAGQREEVGREHPLWWLLNEQPCARFTAATMYEYLTLQMLMRGDGVAYLPRKGRYSPDIAAIIPVPRSNVDIRRYGSRLRYTITDDLEDGTQGRFTVDQDDIIHFPGFGFDGTQGMSVIRWGAREAIGTAIMADQHAANTFATGASLQYAVRAPKHMTTEQQNSFRDAWVAKYGGGVGHSKIPLILTEGLDVKELSMTSEDAQLLGSRVYQGIDISRAFGVPPHMIGDSTSPMYGSGIEQSSKGFYLYTMKPIINRLTQELNRKLFPKETNYFIEGNKEAMLEGDSTAQAAYYSKALGGPGAQGWMTANEVRKSKNLPPIDGGDKLIISGGVPLKPQGQENANP